MAFMRCQTRTPPMYEGCRSKRFANCNEKVVKLIDVAGLPQVSLSDQVYGNLKFEICI